MLSKKDCSGQVESYLFYYNYLLVFIKKYTAGSIVYFVLFFPAEHFDTPTLEDSIKIRFPDHTYLVYVEEDDEINLTQLEDDEDSDDEMEEDDEESEEEVD